MGLFGLFGKKKNKDVQEAVPQELIEQPVEEQFPEDDEQNESNPIKFHFPERGEEPNWIVTKGFNLTENNVKIKVPDDERGERVDHVYLWEDDKTIRGLVGDKIIFEVTSRSKSFKELKPYARHKARFVTIRKRQGDYGIYYRAWMLFDVVVD